MFLFWYVSIPSHKFLLQMTGVYEIPKDSMVILRVEINKYAHKIQGISKDVEDSLKTFKSMDMLKERKYRYI